MAKMPKKYVSLSKKMSLALRHDPEKFGLKPDDEGWVELNTFLRAMKMTREDLDFIQENNSKKRFVVAPSLWGSSIRAYYGHSKVNVELSPVEPPDELYHGTTYAALGKILYKGLKPMSRKYVHHSTDLETAKNVGSRRDENPPVLVVDAGLAHKDGAVKFYHGNEDVWMSDPVPAKYLRVLEVDEEE